MPKTAALVLLVSLTACAIKASNPGPPPGKFSLKGMVRSMEDGAPVDASLVLKNSGGEVIASTDASDGEYVFQNLFAGDYVVEFAGEGRSPVRVTDDARHDVLLPRPAAPGRLRAYRGEGVLCILWDDRSGIESAYRITGDFSYDLPAGAVGIRDAASSVGAASVWVFAENEYGSSVSANATAAKYPPENLVDRRLCRARADAGKLTVITSQNRRAE